MSNKLLALRDARSLTGGLRKRGGEFNGLDPESRCLMTPALAATIESISTQLCMMLPDSSMISERFSRANHKNDKLAKIDSCAVLRHLALSRGGFSCGHARLSLF
jgi:hypothetical protein